jgi:hypothetical protein
MTPEVKVPESIEALLWRVLANHPPNGQPPLSK